MRVCGIVCEYNPFHNGHLYQIEKLKRDCGFEAIVGIMSGNWVQRGDAAIFDKRVRAKAAALNGMDLVIELPAIHAMQSAEIFAENAVYILNSLGIIDTIAFGTETDNIGLLKDIAYLLANESDSFKNIIRAETGSGIPYFMARADAIGRILGQNHKAAAGMPNNILAIEYIKALIKLNSSIEPLAIKRIGAGHNENTVTDKTAGASLIREMILSGNDEYLNLVPENCRDLYRNAKIHRLSNLDRAIVAHFIKCSTDEIKKAPDVSEGLENKIKKSAEQSISFNEMCDKIKSKRYTHSRIRRILLNSYLNITKSDSKTKPQYVKVLSFTQVGQNLIKSAKTQSPIPIGTNFNSVKQNTFTAGIWRRELVFDRIYELL